MGRRTQKKPQNFHLLEKQVTEQFLLLSGFLLAAILSDATNEPEFQEHVDETIKHHSTPLAKARKQTIMIRFLCGAIFNIVTWYYPPARKKPNEVVAENRRGLSPEQLLLGFGVKCTPGLEEKVARAVALYPSVKLAQQELRRQGIKMNTKEIRRIAMQCGEGLLALRYHLLIQEYAQGRHEYGRELAGKSVVVEMDGGRVRIRKNKDAKRKKGRHSKYHADWREPKLMVIYTVDENGKKEKASRVWIDGTFQHANEATDLVISHLRRLGARDAKSVTFIADGADWIWNRFDIIVRESEIPTEKVSYILDFYHASQHLSHALKVLEYEDSEFYRVYKELRHELRMSRWSFVVDRLKELGASQEEKSKFWTEIRYLEKHGVGGHLCYVKFSRRGLPLGSGTVESTIRRVVNLRMKSNGTFWTQENAEKMLQLRCLIMSTEWDHRRGELYHHRLRGDSLQWRWTASEERYHKATKAELTDEPSQKAAKP